MQWRANRLARFPVLSSGLVAGVGTGGNRENRDSGWAWTVRAAWRMVSRDPVTPCTG